MIDLTTIAFSIIIAGAAYFMLPALIEIINEQSERWAELFKRWRWYHD